MTRGLGYFGLIQRIALFSRLLRHAWGYGGPILSRIVTDPHSATTYEKQGVAEDLFLPRSHGSMIKYLTFTTKKILLFHK
jgi:hypothetical protein